VASIRSASPPILTAGVNDMSMRKWIAGFCLASVAILSAPVWAFNTSFLREAPLAYFTDTDWKMFKDTLYKALNQNADGAATPWNNASSGASGEITPLNTREVNGMTCRDTRIINRAQGLSAQGEYPLCKATDGEWTMGGPTN
jgi:surface antigen